MSKSSKKAPEAKNETADRLIAYSVRKYKDGEGTEKTDWLRIGVAFPHSDGKGFNVILHAFPVDGQVSLRTYEPKENESAE